MSRVARVLLLPAMALVLAAPAFADVTFSTGNWQGTTAQKNSQHKHRKITFHADSTTGEITKLKFVETGKCNDGGTSKSTQGPTKADPNNLHTTVGPDGKFVINAKSKTGATTLQVHGKISGNAASGWFSLKSRFNKNTNRPDPQGSIKCSTGTVKWSASFAG